MANENLKKFLDAAGVSHLWGKINEQIDADVKVEADRAKAEEQKLSAKFGDLGEQTVKAYVDAKTENIASNATVAELAGKVATIEGDYVKGADIANFETKENVQAVDTKITDYMTSNNAALAAVKATADAAAVKTEVESALALKANQSALDQTNSTLNAVKGRVEAFLDNTGAATEAIDTLQELINYIETHDDVEISTILADIQKLTNILDGIGGEGEKATVVAYITDAINALEIGTYAKQTALDAVAGRVTALEGKPAASITADQIAAWEAEKGAKALAQTKATMDEVKAEINGRGYETVDNVTSKIDAAKTTLTNDLTAKIATAKGEAIAEAERLNGLMDTRVAAVEAAKHTHANKAELDLIETGDVEKWDGMEGKANAYTDTVFGQIKALSTDEIDAAIGNNA